MKNVWVRSLLTFIVFTSVVYVIYSIIDGVANMQVLLTSAIAGVLFVVLTAIYLQMQKRKK